MKVNIYTYIFVCYVRLTYNLCLIFLVQFFLQAFAECIVVFDSLIDEFPFVDPIRIHFALALLTKLINWILRLTFITRVLKRKYNLKIMLKLFIFQYGIRVHTFFVKNVFMGFVINKTCVHSKSAYHLFVFAVDQSEGNITAKFNAFTCRLIYSIDLHVRILSNFVRLLDTLNLKFTFSGLSIRIVTPNYLEALTVHDFYARDDGCACVFW